MRILAISGSLRASSTNTALVRAIAALALENMEITIYDGLADLPHFSPDLDTDDPPASVRTLRTLLQAVDGVLICTPEYAFGVPGVLKNALDWLVSGVEIYGKPVALLNPSPQSLFAHPQLIETLRVMNAMVIEEACLTLPIAGYAFAAAAIAGNRELGAAF